MCGLELFAACHRVFNVAVNLCSVLCSLPKDVNIFMLDLCNDGCCSVGKTLELLKVASKRLDRAHEGTFT